MTETGFTLIELMVTIAVLAIIVGIAAPSISTQLANQRVKSTTATLINALKEAKAESLIRRQNVRVVYNQANPSRAITILDANNVSLSTYTINSQSTIDVTPISVATVTFQPNKTIDIEGIVYSICDNASSNETARQVRVSKIANISTMATGSC